VQSKNKTLIDLQSYAGVYKNEFYGDAEVKLTKGKSDPSFKPSSG
jgi:hypothetical protein